MSKTDRGFRRGPQLVLGTAQLGMAYGVAGRPAPPDPAEAEAILGAALERGVRALDTAPVYGDAEERIGRFLERVGRPAGLEIGTKLPPIGEGAGPGDVGAIVEAAVESSRRRLRVERIDRYLLHDPADLRRHGRALVDALAGLTGSGRIGRVGISVYGPAEGALALEHPELTVVQHPLNLLDRRLLDGGLLGRLVRGGVEVEARSVFLQGLLLVEPDSLSGGIPAARPILSALRRLLVERNVAPRDAALGFAMASGADRVVVGVDSVEQLEADLESACRPLPRGLAAALAAALPEVPAEVIDPRSWPEAAP